MTFESNSEKRSLSSKTEYIFGTSLVKSKQIEGTLYEIESEENTAEQTNNPTKEVQCEELRCRD